MEFDAEHVHFGQDGLGDFDWSNKDDDTPVSLALMATNSEVPYCSKCRFGIESSSSMESDISSGDETLTDSVYENFKREKAYKAVPPPTGTIIPPRANVSFTGIDELAIRNKVVNQEKTKSSQPEIDRNKVIIEDWVDSDDEETDVSESQKETAFNSENSETSFENRSPNSQNSVGQESRTKGLGNKGGKLCFVCYSPNHLIKDCNLHERTFTQTQTHKPKRTQGSRETRPVWNNIQRVNQSNFSRNSRYPHQRRSFTPSAVLTRDGLISTARPTMTHTVPSKSTANVTYQGTARSRVPQAVLSRSTDGPYYPRMDNRRPRISSYSPSSRSSNPRTTYRPQRPKKIGNPEEDLKDYAIIDSGCSGSMTGDKDKLSDFKEFKDTGYILRAPIERMMSTVESKAHYSFWEDKFSWVFFLAYKDETYDMLHDLIVGLENRLRHKVKTIRCDNGTEFKNQLMNEFCAKKGIKREYSIARTPQQNGVAERKNRTLIEAARTMLADSLLPIQFWAEAVNTACYVLNRVLVTKPQMKTPYEILMGRSPNIKEGYLLGYSTSSKGFRVYNRVTRKVQECLHVDFLENQENQKGKGPDWMFDLDLLTPSMNYIPVRKENYANLGDKVSTLGDVKDLDDQQFIVHTAQHMHPEERTAAKRIAGNTPTDTDDDIPKDGVISTNSLMLKITDTEEGELLDYNTNGIYQ
ncbi:putative ribonuclease H-like domain-containing protein [Tanacetum coccineum]